MLQLLSKTPSDQEPGNVWTDLDASADLSDGGGALEDGDRVACFCETVGSGETAEATTDDNDVDGELSTASLEEEGGGWAGGHGVAHSVGENVGVLHLIPGGPRHSYSQDQAGMVNDCAGVTPRDHGKPFSRALQQLQEELTTENVLLLVALPSNALTSTRSSSR